MFSSEEKENILKRIFRYLKYHKLFIFIIILFCVILLLFIFSDKGIISRAKLEKENEELMKRIAQDSIESIKLDKEINELKTSDKKLEEVAREKYGMSKKGERIFKIKVDSTK